MKTMRNSLMMAVGVALGLGGSAQAVETAAAPLARDPVAPRVHSVYVGLGYGPTSFQPANNAREMEGINFRFTTDAEDLGSQAYIGYWLSDHVALELGGRDFGSVKVPFEFQDPHDNTEGTGESEASFNGVNVSLLVGGDLGESVRVFGRLGAISWQNDLSTRFDIPGEPPIRRSETYSGTGVSYGAGLSWFLESGWQLVAQYEHSTFDDDEMDLMTVGLAFDFAGGP